jgi:hypothetical protein
LSQKCRSFAEFFGENIFKNHKIGSWSGRKIKIFGEIVTIGISRAIDAEACGRQELVKKNSISAPLGSKS